MASNAALVTQILNAFGCQQVHKGKGAVRFIAGLIEAVNILCFIQHLELFLHLRKPVETAISVTQKLFSSDEVVKPDCFEDITVNWCQGIGLLRFALWSNKRSLQRSTFSVNRSGTTATKETNICSSFNSTMKPGNGQGMSGLYREHCKTHVQFCRS